MLATQNREEQKDIEQQQLINHNNNQNPNQPRPVNNNQQYNNSRPRGHTIDFNEPDPPYDDIVYQRYEVPEKLKRLRFIRKVYLTILFQLLLTTLIVCLIMFIDELREYVIYHIGFLIFGCIMTGIILCTLYCIRDQYPINIIFLVLFTIFEAYTVGVICGMYVEMGYRNVVIQAFNITIVLFMALTIFTIQTKWDFSLLGIGLLACLVILSVWGIVIAIMGYREIFWYSLFGAIIFALYIIFDTWWMLQSQAYTDGDWILAAINIYLDLVNLFLYLLSLLASTDD